MRGRSDGRSGDVGCVVAWGGFPDTGGCVRRRRGGCFLIRQWAVELAVGGMEGPRPVGCARDVREGREDGWKLERMMMGSGYGRISCV